MKTRTGYLLLHVFNLLCVVFALMAPANAQVQRSTAVNAGQTVDINVHNDCKRVTYDGWGGNAAITAPWDTPGEWQSFYNNPPPGVTIASCGPSCQVSYGGYCYYHAGDNVAASCDTVCSGRGGCDVVGGWYIGTWDPSGARCSAVGSAMSGSSVTANGATGYPTGCILNSYKGGWFASNFYSPATSCGDTSSAGRICACGNNAPCNLPWGGQIAHGSSVTAYATTGDPCSSETRSCWNGNLSGSYQYGSCTPSTFYCGSSYQCGSYWVGDVYCSGGQSCGSYSQCDDCGQGCEWGTYYYCY